MNLYSVHVRELTLPVSIGIYDFERKAPQPLVISACIILERKANFADDIREVQDYDFLRKTALALAERGHFELQETFCKSMVEACMAQPSVLAAIVRTEKSAVYPDAKGVGCTMTAQSDKLPSIPSWLVSL
jgi:7,8-dihydroneopterin aldolase/epimerase/oxygenase